MTKLWLSSVLDKHNPLSWLFQNLIYRFFHGLMLLLKPVIPVFILPYSSPMTCSIAWFYCLLGFGYVVTMTLKNRYWRRLSLPVAPFWSANVFLMCIITHGLLSWRSDALSFTMHPMALSRVTICWFLAVSLFLISSLHSVNWEFLSWSWLGWLHGHVSILVYTSL